ncbi:MAG: NusG domain II-containing protein [Candidatus Izemoplasmataceae bacterium]
MKKNDIILIIVIAFIALSSFVTILLLQRSSGDTAVVTYHDPSEGDIQILEINLSDGSYTIINETLVYFANGSEEKEVYKRCFTEDYIYCVLGELGIVVIEYDNNRVRVIEETSPQNICQIQGYTNSPLKPLTCLPNYITIIVRTDDELDFNS